MKRFFLIASLFFLANQCASPNVAFIGPVFTGAKTGSIYQASLSYSSNRIYNNFKSTKDGKHDKNPFSRNPLLPDIPFVTEDPTILVSYIVDKIEISDPIEPEPLP